MGNGEEIRQNSIDAVGQDDSLETSPMMSLQLEQNDTLEDDSNMADDENSTTVNNDESNGEAVVNADRTREESFISCVDEDDDNDGDQTMTNNTTTEDPFESFTTNTDNAATETADDNDNSIAVCNEVENGSQDANDAFQVQSEEISKNGKANSDQDVNIEQNDTNSNDNMTTANSD